ncbi:MAG: alpha/beta hydrolase [Phycisphaerae bacterium]|nr:MAG: alpha/beta hydrolase [Phycisphaerae bacterium]
MADAEMPQSRRTWRRLLARALAVLGLAYGASGCLLYTRQDTMLFPRQYTHLRPNTTPPTGAESLWITLPDGARVEGWFRPGNGRSASSPGPALLYCHGNAELIDDNTEYLRAYAARGLSVLLIEYPGYGRSQGEPSQDSITAAGVAFFDLLAARPEVDPARLVIHGKSLGGGVAAQIAARRPAAALILESTFTSVAAFAGEYFMPQWLVKHPFRTDEVLRGFDRPVLIFHGTQDEIIPVAHGRALASIRPDATYLETPGGHNDYPPDPNAYWAGIDGFLAQHSLTPR